MQRGKQLSQKYVSELLRMHGEGLNAQELSDWLLKTHQIEYSAVAIRHKLAKVKEERRPLVEAVIADKLSKTVAPDLDRIGAAIERALQDELNARLAVEEMQEVNGKRIERHPAGADSWARIMTVVSRSRGDLKSLIELRFKLVGALDDGKKQGDSAKSRDDLMAKIDSLMASVSARPDVQKALSTNATGNTVQ